MVQSMSDDMIYMYNGRVATDADLVACAKIYLEYNGIYAITPGCEDQQVWEIY
jgi:hypothetical protein